MFQCFDNQLIYKDNEESDNCHITLCIELQLQKQLSLRFEAY